MTQKRFKVKDANIPQELKSLPQWVCWRWENRDGKPTKPLINAKTSTYASHNKPETWSTFTEALKAYQKDPSKLDGIGFVFSADDPFAGVDLDDCLTPETGELEPWALKIVRALNSYTEVSPSGKGVKIIVKASLPQGAPEGGSKDDQTGIEMYDKLRYFTVTGDVFDVQ